MIYLDNAATTKISKTALMAMEDANENFWGNPSSLHSTGQIAAQELAKAREQMAKAINALPSEIYFTSGGSEADNQAIISAAKNGKNKGKIHLIASKIEHHAVLHTIARLEKDGFTVTYLDVDKNGFIDINELEKAISEKTALVSIMFANNEIGTIQPIQEIGDICKKHNVLFHTDAVQAVGHLEIDVQKLGIDMLSLSGHKFNGPKGVGALYVKKSVSLISLIDGGAQEKNKRAGTENLPAIIGMAAAVKQACDNLEQNTKIQIELRKKLIDGILEIPHSALNGDREKRLPNNTNFCFEGIEGESLLLLLDDKGIAASSGSACTSGSLDPSHVLLAIGRPHEVAHGSLRLSLSHETTPQEIEQTIVAVKQVVEYLRNMSPVWRELQKGIRDYVI